MALKVNAASVAEMKCKILSAIHGPAELKAETAANH